MEDMGQRRLNQLPAGDALDGFGQLPGKSVQLVLHQHPLERLVRVGKIKNKNKKNSGDRD